MVRPDDAGDGRGSSDRMMSRVQMLAVLRSIHAGALALAASIQAAIAIVQSKSNVSPMDGENDEMDSDWTVDGPTLDVSSSASSPEDPNQEAEEDCNVVAVAADTSISRPISNGRPSNLANGQSKWTGEERRRYERGGLPIAMAGIWDGVGGMSTSGQNRHRLAVCEPLMRRIASEQGRKPEDVFRDAVKRFKADPEVTRKRLGLPVLLSQLEVWCAPEPKAETKPEDVAELARQRKLRIAEAEREIEMATDDAARDRWRARLEQLTRGAA